MFRRFLLVAAVLGVATVASKPAAAQYPVFRSWDYPTYRFPVARYRLSSPFLSDISYRLRYPSTFHFDPWSHSYSSPWSSWGHDDYFDNLERDRIRRAVVMLLILKIAEQQNGVDSF